MSNDQWWLYTETGAQGPYSGADLRGWLAAGSITGDWHVCRVGADGWTRLGDVAELNAVPAPVAARPVSGTDCPACGLVSSSKRVCNHCGVVFSEWNLPLDQAAPAVKEKMAPAATASRLERREKIDAGFAAMDLINAQKMAYSGIAAGLGSFFCVPYIFGAAAVGSGMKAMQGGAVVSGLIAVILGGLGIFAQIYFTIHP
jgi:hypothetical protein